jgi:DNA-binding PadR family transcriptional regulator
MMWHGMGGHRHCGPRGQRRDWEEFGRMFAVRWESAQRGEGRRQRMFDGSELRLVLLKLIADETRHGYELIRAIEEMTGGAYAPSPGVVYPTLSLLDEMALIAEQRSDDAKKRFAITDDGRTHLAERAEEVARLLARLEELGSHRRRHQGAPVGRAMKNLAVAIQHRVQRGDFSDETMHEVAGLIDEVAQRIERLK